jgi:hypothetical protein
LGWTLLTPNRVLSRLPIEPVLMVASVALGLLHPWVGRYAMNPDGISYLDVGDSFFRRDSVNAMNAWWSPLYPWTIGLVLGVAKPSPKWEFPLVHLVNLGVFVIALFAFRCLLHTLLRFVRERTSDVKPNACDGLLLLDSGEAATPPMESVIEANKDNYYLALRRTQRTIRKGRQNWEYWLVFFLRTMVKQKNNLAAKVKEEQALRSSLPALSRQIRELAKTRGEITVKEIEESTGANRNTIKVHLRKLASDNYLAQVGKGRGTRYTLDKPGQVSTG